MLTNNFEHNVKTIKKALRRKVGKRRHLRSHTPLRDLRVCVCVHEAVVMGPDWWITPIYLHIVGRLMALLNRKC